MPSAITSRLLISWATVRDSLWFVPALAAIGGAVLAFVAVRIPTPETDGRFVEVWLFGGGVEGARGVLSAIAGSLITVTGVVFSITIVAIQQASSQFTPRVLGSFMADRVNQVVLGVFIGTFTYTLLVLRTIRSAADDRERFVPNVGVTIALVLLLASIAALIVFINHAARSLQVSVILDREARRAIDRIGQLYPPMDHAYHVEAAARDGERPAPKPKQFDDDEAAPPACPIGEPAEVLADRAGYLQAMDAERLWDAGDGRELTVRMELHVGAFAFAGKPLASVWPASALDDELAAAVRDAFVLGASRTMEQDVELGIVEISDIAVRALSPGINDPTTASHAIDRLTEILAAIAARGHPDGLRTSPDGRVRLVVRNTTFGRAIGLAFDRIRHYGAADPSVAKKLLDALMDLGTVATRRSERAAIAEHVEMVRRQALRRLEDPQERAEVEALADRARACADGE